MQRIQDPVDEDIILQKGKYISQISWTDDQVLSMSIEEGTDTRQRVIMKEAVTNNIVK